MSASGGILPTYSRYVNGAPISFTRRSFRARERTVLFLVLLTLGLVCFGTFFFLPEYRGAQGRDSVYRVYDQIKRAGPDLLIPPPPHLDDERDSIRILRHNEDSQYDPHVLDDRAKLKAKIEQDELLKVLEKPDIDVKDRKSSTSRSNGVHPQQIAEPDGSAVDAVSEQKIVTVPAAIRNHYPVITGGEPSDQQTRERRETVKQMMKHAWSGYEKYAWGKNELRPISLQPHSGSVFSTLALGATILDGLDTLYIMGMHDEFKKARDWVANELKIDEVFSDASVFEVNIRFVGGLLTCFALTGDVLFRNKAQEIADKLLPAFNTPTGIPNALVNFKTGNSKNYAWANGGSILSEFGTLHLEFSYLSDVTGNPIYRNKVDHIRQYLQTLEKPKGLYPNYLNPKTGKWGQHHISMGALGDSFYEYLLKAWIQSNKEDDEARQLFDDSMHAVLLNMLQKSPGGLTYFAELKFDRLDHKMDHLACFSGGLFALASKTLKNDLSEKYMDVAKKITHTCHESYDRATVKLGPESFRFTESLEARALKVNEKSYLLRPEVIESYFILYRTTKDPKYREWGWEAVKALEKYCRVAGGYSGLRNVYNEISGLDDVQQSYFLAETLKYLYLLFSDDSLISLDEWVLNTEAHPLPIKGVNPYYREAPL